MDTGRWALPLLDAGQAQKEMAVNEALARLDLLTQAAVVSVGLNAPPSAPVVGESWVVGTAPTGAWAGQAGALAGWTAGGWRFVVARDGLSAWSAADQAWATRTNGVWRTGAVVGRSLEIGGEQVVGGRRPAIPTPAGGAVVDAEARATVAAVLAALRAHGLIAS